MNDTVIQVLSDMALIDFLARVVCGLIIGFALGMTGVGGGVLIIPCLQLVFGMTPVMAVGTASLIATLVKVSAGLAHIKAGNVEWKKSALVLVGSVPVTLITANAVVKLNAIPEYTDMVNVAINVLVVAVMIFSLGSMVLKLNKMDSEVVLTDKKDRPLIGVVAGGGCGFILGSTGIGGGVLLLPLLNSIMKINIKKSVGSSIVIALVLSGISALNYSKGGQTDVVTALLLVVGSFVGVPIAVMTVKKLSDKSIYKATIAIISVSLVAILAR